MVCLINHGVYDYITVLYSLLGVGFELFSFTIVSIRARRYICVAAYTLTI